MSKITKLLLAIVLLLALLAGAGTVGAAASLDEQLIQAAAGGNLALVNALVEKGANVNAADNKGWTPLIRAAQKGHVNVVKLLLDKGADVNAQDKYGWTAVRWARLRNYSETVDLLTGIQRPPYPDTPEGVVKAFIKAALGDVPITVEEMGLDTYILRVQDRYFLCEEDWKANRMTGVLSDDTRSHFSWNKFNIVTDFEIREVQKRKRYAAVKVLYKRLGWIWDYPLNIAECRSSRASENKQKQTGLALLEEAIKIGGKQKGWVWDGEGCRFVHLTNDTEEIKYSLAKPGKFWRIISTYEPCISVSSAIKVLQWHIRDAPPTVRRREASEEQKIGMMQDIRMLEKHLSD